MAMERIFVKILELRKAVDTILTAYLINKARGINR